MYSSTHRFQRANTSGIDNITLDAFKSNLDANLHSISIRMRSDTPYEFSPLHPIRVKKPSGKYRLICIPTVADRIVQKAVQSVLLSKSRWKYAKFNGINYGFVKGKKVSDAVKEALTHRNRNPFVYKTDIQSFFDNVDRTTLKEKIEQIIPQKSLHPLLFAAVDCEIAHVPDPFFKVIKAMGIVRGKGVRQGLPLSPLFSNLYLHHFDEIVRAARIDAIRYADDIIFFSDSEDACHRIHDLCKDKLFAIGLTLPDFGSHSKTILVKPSEPVEFLGISIEANATGQYQLAISSAQREHIRNSILNYADLKYLSEHGIGIATYAQRLRSLVGGFEGAYRDCIDTTSLFESMMQWARKACFELFKRHLNINLASIGKDARRFFEIF